MLSRSVAVPEIVPPREIRRTCGRFAGGVSSPGGTRSGISCALAVAANAKVANSSRARVKRRGLIVVIVRPMRRWKVC
jgi:hypothetical protein